MKKKATKKPSLAAQVRAYKNLRNLAAGWRRMARDAERNARVLLGEMR